MELRQLPAQGHPPVRTEGLPQVLQRGAQLVGRLVEDHGPLLVFQRVQPFPAAFLVDGEEALKGEPPRGQAADRQGIHCRAAAGDGEHLHPIFGTQPHQILSGIGDGRCTGVRHQSTGLPSQQPLQDGLARSGMVVFVVAHQGLFDLKVIQQLHRDPGVLRGDEVHGSQRLRCPGREVPQVADGRGHQIQRTAHAFVSFVRK